MLDPLRSTRLAALAVSIALVVAVSACSSDGSDGSGAPTTAAPSVTTTSTSTTTSTAAVATTTTAPAPVGAPTPAAATDALYQAFVKGDRAAAAIVAEPAAVDAVFGATPGPYALYSGCDTGEFDTSGCLYRDRSTNNTIQFDMAKRGNAWVVTGAFFSAG